MENEQLDHTPPRRTRVKRIACVVTFSIAMVASRVDAQGASNAASRSLIEQSEECHELRSHHWRARGARGTSADF
jgi:hypothetical protein